MERIQKAQAFATQDKATAQYLYGKKTMEINPNHPAIKELREIVASGETPSPEAEETALLLWESAMLESGYTLPDPHDFAVRMDRVLKYNLNLKRDEKPTPYEVVLTDDDEKKDEEKKDEEKKDDVKKDEEKKDDVKKDEEKKDEEKKDAEKKDEEKKDEEKKDDVKKDEEKKEDEKEDL